MAAASARPAFSTDFDPETGKPVEVAPGVLRVTAANRGPYTFTGTNSFILEGERLAVVDPGPDDDSHLAALLAAIAGRPVAAILLTHTHRDHSALARRLKALTAAPLWFEGRHRPSRPRRRFELNVVAGAGDRALTPDRQLRDGEVLELVPGGLQVIATPGHCANHLCFGLGDTPWMLSGDHIMGWNSTMVAVPDGSMADYLASLRRVIALPYRHYLPAHGGAVADGPALARGLLTLREMRNKEIVAAVAGGASSIGDLLRAVYPGLALPLVPAARLTLRSHVEYLAELGSIRASRGLFGTVLRPAA
jgi:glyoxylase-like metal-dependent hydrolase (beta-lactamase superfamily II)